MQSAVSYRFHQVAEQAAGFFLPVLGKMKVNMLGDNMSGLPYFMEGILFATRREVWGGSASLVEGRNVKMNMAIENEKCDWLELRDK